MSDYWEEQKKMPTFAEFVDTWHGSMMCACDHGCNGWLLENAGKAYRIFQAQARGATVEELDAIVQRHVNDVAKEIRKEMWDKK